MKRTIDVSRPPGTAGKDPTETSMTPSGCASAAELAGVLLAHTMHETEAPISELSEALARVAREVRSVPAAAGAAHAMSTEALQSARDAITRDIAVCIESLQFHDRLMQQLKRIHDLLAAMAANRRVGTVAPPPANKGSIELF